METIYIPNLLNNPNKKKEINVDEFLTELDTLTPIKGKIILIHGGNYLEIKAKVETIVTLKCDRCLQQYNHRLGINTKEIIWLDKNVALFDKNLPQEREITQEDLSEKLAPWGNFNPQSWLYEQLCLSMPMRKLCGKNCKTPANLSTPNPTIDRRWAGLEALKRKL